MLVRFLTAAALFAASSAAFSQHLIVEKKVFELPLYSTVGNANGGRVRISAFPS